jgi:hypothetical protein
MNKEMNSQLKYQLDKSSRKYNCPSCKKKRFVRYVDIYSGKYLSDRFGRCDREINCGYFLKPDENPKINIHEQREMNMNIQPSEIPYSIMRKSLQGYNKNNLIQFLLKIFNYPTVQTIIEKYYIGTSKHWKGSSIFWQITKDGIIRAGKIIQYDPANGKRIKEPTNHITWVHKAANIQDYNLKQCLFGEHLLCANPGTDIAIVESEKTAIISSVYFPEYTWLSVGSLNGLTFEKFRPLANRNVILFPDANGFHKWTAKANALQKEFPSTKIKVSEIIEKHVSDNDKNEGYDLADYLLKFPVTDFHKVQTLKSLEPDPPIQTIGELFDMFKTKGYKRLPDNIQINSGTWRHNSFQKIPI